MEEKELDLGEYEVTWTLAGRDILKAEIRVTDTGVTCLSVGAGGLCYSATPPGVTISAFTVTGYLKPVVVAPTTCIQSFKVTDSETGNPIAGATISLTRGKGPLTTNSSGRCNVQLETGKSYGWSVLKGGYKTGYPPLFTACTAEKSIQLEPLAAPPLVQPPEVAEFGLSEVVENHLPGWITGYACASCSGGYAYKCPSGYKRTVCYVQTRLGVHGCCSSCIVAFVKCERVAAAEVSSVGFKVSQPGAIAGQWLPATGATVKITETGQTCVTARTADTTYAECAINLEVGKTYSYIITKSGFSSRSGSFTAGVGKIIKVSFPVGVTPPPTISSWIDETGVHNLTRKHWLYVYDLYIGANAAAEALYSVLSPKPSRISSSLVTRKNWLALYNYSIGAISAGNALSGANY